jgi:hypothetical protein
LNPEELRLGSEFIRLGSVLALAASRSDYAADARTAWISISEAFRLVDTDPTMSDAHQYAIFLPT